jgi:DNA-binding GntR family transcriptional regulator
LQVRLSDVCIPRHLSYEVARGLASSGMGKMITMQPGVPKYQQLAELIRSRILDGTYLIGEQLPSEVSLMEETSYSRDTVRAAVKLLRESRWVTVTHGLGTFVNPPEMRQGE